MNNEKTRQDAMQGDMERMRQQSDYLKRVADFARYMQSEYINPSDERSLLIVATDRCDDNPGKRADAAIVLGPKHLNMLGLAMHMGNDGGDFAEMIADARAWSLRNAGDEPVLERLATERSRRRKCIAMLTFIGCWCVFLAVLDLVMIRGLLNTLSLVSNLLLMAFLAWLTVRDLRQHNRAIASLERELHNDREKRAAATAATIMHNLASGIARQLGDDEDDE